MIKPRLAVSPAPLLTLAEIKAWLRIDHSDDDLLLAQTASAAVNHLDGYRGVLGRCIVTQSWIQDFACFESKLKLWCTDVQSAIVKYKDFAGDQQTLAASQYEVLTDARGSFLQMRRAFAFPTLSADQTYPVTVEFVAGFGPPAQVPDDFKVCALQITAHWYLHREMMGDVSALPIGPMDFIARNSMAWL
jgi:uncharacterized phiE125 gp8 family phage protein